MSLRDDLDLILSEAEPSRHSHEAFTKFNDAVLRLRAALTPAAEKWLEELPELLKLMDELDELPIPDYFKQCDGYSKRIDLAMWETLEEAAALHNAQDNKEQK